MEVFEMNGFEIPWIWNPLDLKSLEFEILHLARIWNPFFGKNLNTTMAVYNLQQKNLFSKLNVVFV